MANNEEITLHVSENSPYVIGARAYVEQTENGAVITIIDKEGTTTATVSNGKGIASATLNEDYTLTLIYTDGTSVTTTSIRGEKGESGVYCGSEEPDNPDVDVWIDPTGDPYPMEDEIADAVDEWITAHPEYVTTVQDGAITVPKFAAGVVDAGLNKAGYPADSKATGDAFTADRTRLTAVEGEADALDARITNLAQLTDGSTTGDAELMDARVVGSTTYSTLHEAIDTEFTNVKSEINLIEKNILFDGVQILPPFNNELYGGTFNGASYSNGVLTIPSGSTGKNSYIGINLLQAGDFSKLVDKLVHIRVEYTDLSDVDVYPYMFTNSAYTSHIKTIASNLNGNIMDYWLTIDTTGMSYIFVGVRVSADSPSQASSVSFSVENKVAYYADIQDLSDDTKNNSNAIETIVSKLPKERTTAVVADSTNSSLFMYSTGKVLSIGNVGYKIKVYPVTKGNYYNFYSDGFSLADSSYVALAFSTSANVVVNAVPEEILFRPSTTASVVDMPYYCQKSGFIWAAQAPSSGEITVYNTQLSDIDAGSALNFKGYKKILTIGDSLTNATGGGDSSIRWQNILTSILKMEGHSRSGAIGLTVADIGGGGSIYSAVQALTTEADVDIISFWGGTNDWSNDVPLGDFDTEIVKATSDATTFYGACIECVKKIITLYPAKRIFCVGTTPRYINVDDDEYSNDTTNNINLYLLDYVDALKKVAEYFGLPFLDLYRTSGINKLNISQYMFMQTLNGNKYYLHFSVDGEYQIAYRMAGFISKIG